VANQPLDRALAKEAVEAVRTHGSVSAAAKALGLARPTFNSRYARAKDMGLVSTGPRECIDGAVEKIAQPLCYESAWIEWQRFIGQGTEHYAGPKKPRKGARKRIVVASDFHIPFHDKGHVAELFKREADADLLIINGDLQDFYSISRFIKYEQMPIERELAEVTLFLEQASQVWPEILIVGGNHDHARFEKQLRDRLDPEMVKVVEFLAGGNLSPIAAIARRYPNVKIAKVKADRFDVSWMAQVGDLVVTHAEKFSITPGAALRKIDEWLTDMGDVLDLEPWRVLVQAHTHQLGIVPWKSDRLLIEGGCMCSQHGYQLAAKIGGRPQRRGWITLEQVNGVTDMGSIRMTWLDAERKVA
jgi:predicted phosphodiesterase